MSVNVKERNAWRDKLLAERDRMRTELDSFKESTSSTARESSGDLSSYSSHMADQGTDTMEREKVFLLASQLRRRLEEVSEALQRLEGGTFGTCQVCGQPIPPRRLERMPTASTCVACQEKREKQEKQGSS
jgi:DnaK suppressor protein